MAATTRSAMDALLEIDLAAIQANWRALDGLGPAETAAAVKADGYGLGAAPAARALHEVGCRVFFVATLGEATALDAALGPREAVIYVLNGFLPGERPAERSPDRLRPVLSTAEAAADWAARGDGPAALQVETGMNRLGIAQAAFDRVAALGDRLEIALILSHLACSDEPEHAHNAVQRERFEDALAVLRPAFPRAAASLAATGGALLGPDFAYDLVRPGIGLFGGLPFRAARPVVRLSAPLIRVWDVAAGEPSGYGAAWVAERPTRLATAPLGYADGLPRLLSNQGRAHVRGVVAPIVGRVSMDLTVLDVSACPAAAPGDRAYFLDEKITVDQMAAPAGTIGYEILTKLGYRAERRYNA